jgi:hypothetical protein
MNPSLSQQPKSWLAAVLAVWALSSGVAQAGNSMLQLSGDQEVPPVTSTATGSGTISIGSDGAVSGSVTTTGLTGTMGHIHMGPAKGQNGPVIVPLTQTSPGVWAVPPGTQLTPEQMKAYQEGRLYVNIHSAEHKAGEIRAVLMP